jgi:hypothetical protein
MTEEGVSEYSVAVVRVAAAARRLLCIQETSFLPEEVGQ